jgi:hypothetical protein
VAFISPQQQVELEKRMRYNFGRYQKQIAEAEQRLIYSPRSTTSKK